MLLRKGLLPAPASPNMTKDDWSKYESPARHFSSQGAYYFKVRGIGQENSFGAKAPLDAIFLKAFFY